MSSGTRSSTGNLPKGSRNERLANLAQGLPASGINPKGSRGSIPEAEQQQQAADEGHIELPVHVKLPSRVAEQRGGSSSQPPTTRTADAEHIQNVCDAATLPLHQEIVNVREEVKKMSQAPPVRQQQQPNLDDDNPQVNALMDAIKSLGDVKRLIDDVSMLRQDTNYLLENASNQHDHGLHIPKDEPEVKHPEEIEKKYDLKVPKVKQEPNLQDKTLKIKIKDNKIIMVDSDDESIEDTPDVIEETTREEELIPFFSRKEGPAYPGLTTIRPSDPDFDRLMNYRFYRLIKRAHQRSADSMIVAHRRLTAMTLTLGEWKFDGRDPILIFQFLTRLTEEADLNQLTEAQAFATLPRFLSGMAETQFRSARGSSRAGGIHNWPQAIQYLLQTYATPSAIRQAAQRVQDTKQLPQEDETEFSLRLNNSITRCGNVYDETKRMTLFVNGLIPEIQPMVARYRERSSRTSLRYEELVQYARDEGLSFRARNKNQRPSPRLSSAGPKRSVHFVDEYAQLEGNTPSQQQLMYLGGDSHQEELTSIDTNELPSTEPSLNQGYLEEEQLLYTETTRPPAIRYGDRQSSRNRPGWVNKPKLVCYHCYAKDKHVSPDCDITANQLSEVIRNYDLLTAQERERVPRIAYNIAKQLAKSLGGPENSNEGGNHSKNV